MRHPRGGRYKRRPIKARSGKAFYCRLSRASHPSLVEANIMIIRYGTAIQHFAHFGDDAGDTSCNDRARVTRHQCSEDHSEMRFEIYQYICQYIAVTLLNLTGQTRETRRVQIISFNKAERAIKMHRTCASTRNNQRKRKGYACICVYIYIYIHIWW